jgi:hypothetical protein
VVAEGYANTILQDIIVKNVAENVYVFMEKENIDVRNVVEVKYVNMTKISLIVRIVKVQIGVSPIIN